MVDSWEHAHQLINLFIKHDDNAALLMLLLLLILSRGKELSAMNQIYVMLSFLGDHLTIVMG